MKKFKKKFYQQNYMSIVYLARGMSTKEEIKKLIFNNIGNPYDKGCSKNCGDFWTRHKKYEKSYKFKYLRVKTIIMKDENKN